MSKDNQLPEDGTKLHYAVTEELSRTDSFTTSSKRTTSSGRLRVEFRQVVGGMLCDGTMPADGSMPAKPPDEVRYFNGPASATYGLTFSNLPILNLRQEFIRHRDLLTDETFRASVANMQSTVELPGLTWRGLPHNVLTYMLQRAILGLESCATAAVDYELRSRKLWTEKLQEQLDEPYTTPPRPRGTADALYNKLPGLIDSSLRMKASDPSLWGRVSCFYSEVRNPLLHGYQLHCPTPDLVRPCFDIVGEIHSWLSSWWRAFG